MDIAESAMESFKFLKKKNIVSPRKLVNNLLANWKFWYISGELNEQATISKMETVQTEGARQILERGSRRIKKPGRCPVFNGDGETRSELLIGKKRRVNGKDLKAIL